MFIYESHLGGLYSTDYELSFDELYCDECGDSDSFLGEYEDALMFWNDIKDGFYDVSYIMEFIEGTFNITDIGYRIYLLCEDINGNLFVDFKPHPFEFGECHKVRSIYCLNEDLEYDLVESLLPWVNEVKILEKVGWFDNIVLYKAVVEPDVEDMAEDTVSYMWNSWYGYVNLDNYNPIPEESWIKDYIV